MYLSTFFTQWSVLTSGGGYYARNGHRTSKKAWRAKTKSTHEEAEAGSMKPPAMHPQEVPQPAYPPMEVPNEGSWEGWSGSSPSMD